MVDLHEFGGCYKEDKGFPGMSIKEMQALLPSLVFPEEINVTEGWYKGEMKENKESLKERVRRVYDAVKQLAAENEEDYSVVLITHEIFMNSFFSFVLQNEYPTDSDEINRLSFFFSEQLVVVDHD